MEQTGRRHHSFRYLENLYFPSKKAFKIIINNFQMKTFFTGTCFVYGYMNLLYSRVTISCRLVNFGPARGRSAVQVDLHGLAVVAVVVAVGLHAVADAVCARLWPARPGPSLRGDSGRLRPGLQLHRVLHRGRRDRRRDSEGALLKAHLRPLGMQLESIIIT